MGQKNRSSAYLWVLVALLLCATFLGARQLNVDLFWLDEEFSIYMSGGDIHGPVSLWEIITRIKNHAWPPLYNLLLIPWGAVVGWSEVSLRIFALLPGILAIAAVYRLGADLRSPRVGLLSALIMTTSAFYIHYLHEARAYTLFVLFMTLSLWSYWYLLRRNHRGVQLLFLLSTTALLYTHYLAVAACAGFAIYHLFFVRKNYAWHRLTRLGIGCIVLFVPWIPFGIVMTVAETQDPRGLENLEVLQEVFYGFTNGMAFYAVLMIAAGAIILRGREVGFLGIWLIASFIASLVMNHFVDFLFHIRHIMFLLPVMYVLMAMTIDQLVQKTRWLGGGVLLVWVVVGGYQLTTPQFIDALKGQQPMIPRAFLTTLETTLDACATPDDVLILYASRIEDELFNNRLMIYYLQALGYDYALLGTLGNLRTMTLADGDYAEKAAALTKDAPNVWFFQLNKLPDTPLLEAFDASVRVSHSQCVQHDSEMMMIRAYSRGQTSDCVPVVSVCQ